MKTITFYSYKGGVGRSLALVNIATRLVEFGKKVCVIDFDLEAPGLHLKFPVNKDQYQSNKGIVDFVYEFSNNGVLETSIKDYSVDVTISSNGLPLSLICAGQIESSEYWRKLSSINWYHLIFENPNGLSFFLHLKEIIQKEIKPDFLLIDSRTGISEMSGITLSVLADEVVIVAANNAENLSGAKRIISSLNNKDNNLLGRMPEITFVLSRIPFTDKPEDKARELQLVTKIKRDYLAPFVSEINIIHSDRELEEQERVKIAYENNDTNTQISIDYLRLFERLTKNDLSEAEVSHFKNIRQSERFVQLANVANNTNLKIEYLSKAIQLNPAAAEFLIYRGGVYYDNGDFQMSLEDAQNALRIDKRSDQAYCLIIDSYIKQKDYKNAEIIALEQTQLMPTLVHPLIQLAVIYSNMERYQDVIAICNKAIQMAPEYAYGYSFKANALRLLKEFDKALEDVYKSLELNSESIQGVLTLAEIYAETGKINEFYLQFESALKIAQKKGPKIINEVLEEEFIYQKFFKEERFINLLAKYGFYLPHLEEASEES